MWEMYLYWKSEQFFPLPGISRFIQAWAGLANRMNSKYQGETYEITAANYLPQRLSF